MSRFLGGVFGNTRPSTADVPNTTGVYDLNGQYYVKQEGGWLDPISASGGDVTDTSTFPGKSVHIFTGPGNFVVSSGSGNVEVLLVSGGGGGGGAYGGGGGGGAYVPITIGVSAGTYPITVGPGGSAGVDGGGHFGTSPWPSDGSNGAGGQGGDSIFGGPTQPEQVTVQGGGGGAGRGTKGGPSDDPYGGSGGGGGDGYPSGNQAGGEAGSYGNDGGTGMAPPVGPTYRGGGGGGAGSVGETGPQGGVGGVGSNNYPYVPPSYGTSGPSPGRYFAGGGSGGDQGFRPDIPGPPAGGGGDGGGGPGGGGAASSNTGGGGGGGPDGAGSNPSKIGGAGGSGIVIVTFDTA